MTVQNIFLYLTNIVCSLRKLINEHGFRITISYCTGKCLNILQTIDFMTIIFITGFLNVIIIQIL